MDFFLLSQIQDFLGRIDTFLDREIFGVVPAEAKVMIAMVAESLSEDGKFDAMQLFDILITGAPSLDRSVHAEMYYQFTGFAEAA